MKHLIIAAALCLAACAPPAAEESPPAPQLETLTLPIADAAGNRMEALSEQAGRWCSGDGAWCIAVGETNVTVTHNGQDTELMTIDSETGTPVVWPVIIREGAGDDSVQLGLGWQQSQMYSGGGADVTRVTLYRLTQGSRLIPEVLTWPLAAEKSIRACFDEEDAQQRRDACLDTYNFAGQLSLDTDNASGPPRLVLTTLATTYPGDLSLDQDSTARETLQESDLVTVRDAACSYRSVLTFNGASYDYDNEPPVCEDYLEP